MLVIANDRTCQVISGHPFSPRLPVLLSSAPRCRRLPTVTSFRFSKVEKCHPHQCGSAHSAEFRCADIMIIRRFSMGREINADSIRALEKQILEGGGDTV